MAPVKWGTAVLVVLLAGFAAACAGDDDGVAPVASRQCAPLVYEGEGEPDVIVVSDLPRRGIGAETTELMVGAIEFVLRKREFRAESCASATSRATTPSATSRSIHRSAGGTWRHTSRPRTSSGSSARGTPPARRSRFRSSVRRAAGPLAMISPSNTYEGLTRSPASGPLYPDGVRSYARIVALNSAQGAASARLARTSVRGERWCCIRTCATTTCAPSSSSSMPLPAESGSTRYASRGRS